MQLALENWSCFSLADYTRSAILYYLSTLSSIDFFTMAISKTVIQLPHLHRFDLYLKLLLAMGINWTMEVISWAVEWQLGSNVPEELFYATDFCNACYGVIIFIIFVCNKEKRRRLRKWYTAKIYSLVFLTLLLSLQVLFDYRKAYACTVDVQLITDYKDHSRSSRTDDNERLCFATRSQMKLIRFEEYLSCHSIYYPTNGLLNHYDYHCEKQSHRKCFLRVHDPCLFIFHKLDVPKKKLILRITKNFSSFVCMVLLYSDSFFILNSFIRNNPIKEKQMYFL